MVNPECGKTLPACRKIFSFSRIIPPATGQNHPHYNLALWSMRIGCDFAVKKLPYTCFLPHEKPCPTN